ncbi:ArsR/SmtB family transcription factor [Actinomadura oligospora]|uniref:ArsR/SmtB family transcription factor n=1 Tax=Actinomadura oligospora TaxID=111804 RepID=UPI001B80C543|nr:winged helix-turn-helix domain-containing protein [Actinomadura oligospora]
MTPDDVARTRILPTPQPLCELAASLMERRWPAPERGRPPRHPLARRVPVQETRLLLELTPDGRRYPRFLSPTRGFSSFEESLDTVLGTPAEQVRADLEISLGGRRPNPWLRGLAAGDREARHRLDQALRRYYRDCVVPDLGALAASGRANAAELVQAMGENGLADVFRLLRPWMHWSSPVLTVMTRTDRDLRPGGKGIVLIPSVFSAHPFWEIWDDAITISYPVRTALDAASPQAGDSSEPLAALLGRTRAAILRAAEDGAGTGALAAMVGISAPSASQHAKALRNAGLLLTVRVGKAVQHTATPLGRSLLASTRPTGAPIQA